MPELRAGAPSNGATARPIFEPSPDGPRKARTRPVYFPIVYAVSDLGTAAPVGYDLGADPERAPFLRRARDRGKPVATPPVKLLIGGIGINIYRPVYRDGAPTATVAQRRAALIGFAGGAFRVSDLAQAAISAVPDAVDVQLRIDRDTRGRPPGTSSTTPPARRSRSPTAPGCWSSATPTGPTSACRCCWPWSASRWRRCWAR